MREEISLRVQDVARSFGKGAARVAALQDISLTVPRGEVTLFMGPSGSGKSTLLAVLSGLLKPDRGRVVALGQDLYQLSDRERKQFRLLHCGFIFQGYNLFPALTALQQLEIVLRWGEGASEEDARQRSDEMLELLGLRRQKDLRPAQLSGGEKQRVAIGRALIKGPDLCFADEPTSALDWAHGEPIVELLRAAARDRDASVLIVSHDLRLIPYADRVFHLSDGCLVEPEDVADQPIRSLQ
jgi:putative ABC transport system ATP-binding protein